MTEPSQYFKGRTVQEQMNEVIGYVDVRSAEVATDAIAADVAQVHQDMLDADADAAAAAASAAAAAGTLANAVKKTGEASQSIAGDIAVAGDLSAGGDLGVTGDLSVGGTGAFTGAVAVPAPVNNTDAANKKYVDDADALKINITDINSYAIGLTGNQEKIGDLEITGNFETSMPNFGTMRIANNTDDNTDNTKTGRNIGILFVDANDVACCRLMYQHNQNTRTLYLRFYKSDGSYFPDIVLGTATES